MAQFKKLMPSCPAECCTLCVCLYGIYGKTSSEVCYHHLLGLSRHVPLGSGCFYQAVKFNMLVRWNHREPANGL